jgi:integrase
MAGKAKHGQAFSRVAQGLYRHGQSGFYYANVKRDGKIVRKSLRTTDRATANRLLKDFLNDLGKVDRTGAAPGLNAYVPKFLTTLTGAPKTLRQWQDIGNKLLRDWPGKKDIRLDKIREGEVRAWLASYTFGPVSYNYHLIFIRRLFAQAVRDRLIAENPAQGIPAKKRPKVVRVSPSREDFQRIIADVREQKYSADAEESADLLEFMGLAGLGQAEAAGLRWEHVDWHKKTLTVFRLKTKSGFVIPMYPQVEPLLQKRRDAGLADPKLPVFGIKDAKRALSAACKRLGLPNYSQRSLRRMFITQALQNRVDVKTIAKWQGHKDGGKLILTTYSHLIASHEEDMAKLMA